MTDTWDDSDDDAWDASDNELEERLNNLNVATTPVTTATATAADFDDEEDLAVKERAEEEARGKALLKAKGSALAKKKADAEARKEEEEIAKKVLAREAEMEANMTPDERRRLERERIEQADNALTDDLFGGMSDGGAAKKAASAGDKLVLKDLADHLKHARKIGSCVKGHGKPHLAIAFLKEVVQQCKDVIEDDEITELIKTCNVIKNDKLLAMKKKAKGQAQKAKRDKAAEAKAKKLQTELYGESAQYDEYDAYGEQYEDDFF